MLPVTTPALSRSLLVLLLLAAFSPRGQAQSQPHPGPDESVWVSRDGYLSCRTVRLPDGGRLYVTYDRRLGAQLALVRAELPHLVQCSLELFDAGDESAALSGLDAVEERWRWWPLAEPEPREVRIARYLRTRIREHRR